MRAIENLPNKKIKNNPQRNPRRKNPIPPRNEEDLNWNKILKVILGWSANYHGSIFHNDLSKKL